MTPVTPPHPSASPCQINTHIYFPGVALLLRPPGRVARTNLNISVAPVSRTGGSKVTVEGGGVGRSAGDRQSVGVDKVGVFALTLPGSALEEELTAPLKTAD